MTKEELIQKEIARILAENPENPVVALRAKRKQALTLSHMKAREKRKHATPLTDVVLTVSRVEK